MIALFRKFSAVHAAINAPAWLRSSRDWRFQLGALVLILLAAMINYDVRDTQWQDWKANAGSYFVDDTPMVTTTDAAFFLANARDYQQGAQLGRFDSTRLYPDKTDAYRQRHDEDYTPLEARPVKATDMPLLAPMIAHSADLFTDGNLALAGNLMIPYALFVTVFAVGCMFWVAGFPAEGAVAGVGIGLSAGFIARTSIGRIDTDQLFVFFLAASLALVLLAARERNLSRMIGFVLLLSMMVSLAFWWHSNTLFTVVIPVVLVASLYLHQHDWKRTVLAFGVFSMAANPVFMFGQFYAFGMQLFERITGVSFAPASPYAESALIFPNTFTTITELARLDILGTLGTMTPIPVLGLIGALGFLAWVFLNPRKGVVFLPFFILGLLAVVSGRRFAFFASPFVWFGLAWIFLCLARWLALFSARKAPASSFTADGTTLAMAAVAVLGTAAISPAAMTPPPTFSTTLTKSFNALKPIAGDQGGVLATWWDYGYYAHFHSELDTFHDGGVQGTPRTHLFARGLTSDSIDELIQITKFVSTEGSAGIAANTSSLNGLNRAIAAAAMPDKPVYLMVTNQMAGWMGSIATLGRFNVETGRPVSGEQLQQYQILELICQRVADAKFQCRRGLLDLEHGTLDGKPVIGEVVLVRDGFVEKTDRKPNRSPWKLVILAFPNGTASFQLMHRANWENSFNKLFHQADFNPERLEMVLDHYPVARVYRIKQ